MTTYPTHEAANIFPMEDETIQELADDIAKNGQHVPAQLLDGKLIDGRRRMAACVIAGVALRTEDIKTDDPVGYVLSLNLHRRHLNPSQLAMVGARARDLYDSDAKRRQQASGGDRKSGKSVVENFPQPNADAGKARDQVGKVVGVSGKTIDHATKVLKNAIPEVVKAVDEGRMAVSTAAILSSEPPEVQLKEVSNPKRKRTYKAAARKSDNPKKPAAPEGELQGKGVIFANEAVNCLSRIPKNDPLRQRGFRIVMDWIKHNK